MNWEQIWSTVQLWLVNVGIKIVIALIVLVVAFNLINLISKKLAVELMPEAVRPPAPAPQAAATAETTADIRFATVTPELIEKYQLEADSRGVVVTEVRPGSDAEIKGIKSGDLITEIDKKAVLDINDAQAAVDDARRENNRPVLFLINNHNIPHYAAVKL